MKVDMVARRYARSLFSVTVNLSGGKAQYLEMAKQCQFLLERSNELFSIPEAARLLKSPVAPAGLKKSLLDYALEGTGCPDFFKGFISVLLGAGRVSLLPAIAEAYEELVYDDRGVLRATVKTATPLSGEQKGLFGSVLEEFFKKKIQPSFDVDPSLLGGFTVRVGHNLFDRSLRAKVSSMLDFESLSGA
ncbi:MAG: ATP synthase F1 subunit delta [Oligoflexales bacterium]|nr:ATP synthase F1 subunit delta [Oligoflexales bacterium]